MYDWLDWIEKVSTVELAHPYRVRAIAAAQVKTDSIDAHTLAQLLRVNLIPRAYVPGGETRRLREVVRERVFLMRVRTMVKNQYPLSKIRARLNPSASNNSISMLWPSLS
jgi:transposase